MLGKSVVVSVNQAPAVRVSSCVSLSGCSSTWSRSCLTTMCDDATCDCMYTLRYHNEEREGIEHQTPAAAEFGEHGRGKEGKGRAEERIKTTHPRRRRQRSTSTLPSIAAVRISANSGTDRINGVEVSLAVSPCIHFLSSGKAERWYGTHSSPHIHTHLSI